MLTRGSLISRVLLVLAIIIVANVISSQFFARLDFTGDKRYTLSNATKNILKELDESVTVTAYFSEDLPPQVDKIKTDFEELLVEYNQRSGGNVNYEFVNPNEDEASEQTVMQEGIQPQVINVRERDQFTQKRVYLGAKVQYGDQKEVLPFVGQGATMEYEMSKAIKKVSVSNKPKIGFINGHGEATISTMQQVAQALQVLYTPEQVSLNDTSLSAYKTLVLVNPKDTIPPAELSNLDAFVEKGGRLLIAMNRVDLDFQTVSGKDVVTGLETWLNQKGINVDGQFVTDVNCGQISVQNQQRTIFGMPMQQRIKFHYFPNVKNFDSDHIISKGLEQVTFPGVSPINYSGAAKFIPLATTSSRSGFEAPPFQIDINRKWRESDFVTSNLTVAAAIEGNIVGNNPSKMVIFGDADFVINGEGQQAQRQTPDNINFFVNAVDWLSDDTGLSELRTKMVTARPLKSLEDGTKTMIKWSNFLIPILLILGYGLIRNVFRSRKRAKWASERYN